jgi:N-acyl-D-aspartate/D-glutamate deacylase
MAYDLVIKNGMIIDGTGFARYRGDIGITNGTITEIGHINGAAAQTIDADGRFVAPGIIDLHTHYDAQPFWDRLCTPSVWHGVTTVLAGNCGLTLAPLRPEHREAMLATFCCVEDLPMEALAGVLPWTWESFDEYLQAIDIGLGLNIMPLVGHNPLRLSAMGQVAWERAASADEIATMQRLLQNSLEAGAWGWSTTVSPTHAGPSGEPVPTRLAENDERLALSHTIGAFNRGIIEVLPPSVAVVDEPDQQHLFEIAMTSQRPVFFLGFSADRRAYIEASARQGAQLYTLLRAIPFNRQFTLKRTTFFRNLDVWDAVMELSRAERLAALAHPEKRAAMREVATKPQRRRPGVPGRLLPWAAITVRKVALEKNRALEGRRLTDLAEACGKHVADVMLDLALEEGLETEFQIAMRPPEEDVRLTDLVKTDHAIPSQSDAGAHLNTNFCTAGESSYVLGEWVRERQLLGLEDAIRRMTFQPACIMGLHDRGLIRQGMKADMMVFDLAQIGPKDDELWHDGPGGTPRRVHGATGVHHVIVNGQVVLNHGQHTGALPGRVLRSTEQP